MNGYNPQGNYVQKANKDAGYGFQHIMNNKDQFFDDPTFYDELLSSQAKPGKFKKMSHDEIQDIQRAYVDNAKNKGWSNDINTAIAGKQYTNPWLDQYKQDSMTAEQVNKHNAALAKDKTKKEMQSYKSEPGTAAWFIEQGIDGKTADSLVTKFNRDRKALMDQGFSKEEATAGLVKQMYDIRLGKNKKEEISADDVNAMGKTYDSGIAHPENKEAIEKIHDIPRMEKEDKDIAVKADGKSINDIGEDKKEKSSNTSNTSQENPVTGSKKVDRKFKGSGILGILGRVLALGYDNANAAVGNNTNAFNAVDSMLGYTGGQIDKKETDQYFAKDMAQFNANLNKDLAKYNSGLQKDFQSFMSGLNGKQQVEVTKAMAELYNSDPNTKDYMDRQYAAQMALQKAGMEMGAIQSLLGAIGTVAGGAIGGVPGALAGGAAGKALGAAVN